MESQQHRRGFHVMDPGHWYKVDVELPYTQGARAQRVAIVPLAVRAASKGDAIGKAEALVVQQFRCTVERSYKP